MFAFTATTPPRPITAVPRRRSSAIRARPGKDAPDRHFDVWKDAVRRLREARSKHTTNLTNNLKEWMIDDAEFMREMVDALRTATRTNHCRDSSWEEEEEDDPERKPAP